MPSFIPFVSVGLPPAISVTLTNITYGQFRESLGSYVYKVDSFYIYSSNLQQIQGSLGFTLFDSNGNQNIETIVHPIDAYQYEPALFVDTNDKNVILNGNSYATFTMLPNTTLLLRLYCERITNGDDLDLYSPNNFIKLEDKLSIGDFFDQYQNIIPATIT